MGTDQEATFARRPHRVGRLIIKLEGRQLHDAVRRQAKFAPLATIGQMVQMDDAGDEGAWIRCYLLCHEHRVRRGLRPQNLPPSTSPSSFALAMVHWGKGTNRRCNTLRRMARCNAYLHRYRIRPCLRTHRPCRLETARSTSSTLVVDDVLDSHR